VKQNIQRLFKDCHMS